MANLVRLKQLDKPELSGYILNVTDQSYYPNANPSGYISDLKSDNDFIVLSGNVITSGSNLNSLINTSTIGSVWRVNENLLWKMRRSVAEAVKSNSIYKEEDTVVPRYELPKLLFGIKEIGAKYGFKSVCYGHAGDGNLHVNIIKGDMSDDNWNTEVTKGIREIFELTVSLKGTLSGEHGIGFVQKNYMDIAFSESHLKLMKGIKTIFDPKGILNPGKIFPDNF